MRPRSIPPGPRAQCWAQLTPCNLHCVLGQHTLCHLKHRHSAQAQTQFVTSCRQPHLMFQATSRMCCSLAKQSRKQDSIPAQLAAHIQISESAADGQQCSTGGTAAPTLTVKLFTTTILHQHTHRHPQHRCLPLLFSTQQLYSNQHERSAQAQTSPSKQHFKQSYLKLAGRNPWVACIQPAWSRASEAMAMLRPGLSTA